MMFWGWDGAGPMGGAAWAVTIIWAIFWVAVIVAIVLLIRHLLIRSGEGRWTDEERHSQARHLWHRSNALNILEERYARGEIDREEFLRRKADLS